MVKLVSRLLGGAVVGVLSAVGMRGLSGIHLKLLHHEAAYGIRYEAIVYKES